MGKDAGYLDAIKLAEGKGGLPSNVLLDDILMRSDRANELKKLREADYFPAWAREVLVYPEKNGVFKKGKDIVDAYKDGAGRQWIFPCSSIPIEAIGKKGAALFVDPLNVEVTGSKVIVTAEPETVIVLNEFLQTAGWGKVDKKTKVPLNYAKVDDLPSDPQRYLWRIDGQGVRPLVRYVGDFDYYRRYVVAGNWQYGGFGVASVELEQAEPKLAAAISVSGVTAEEFGILLKDAKASLSGISQTVKEEKTEPIRKLIEALRIRD